MKISFLFETKILAVSHSMKQNVLFKFFIVQPSHTFISFETGLGVQPWLA